MSRVATAQASMAYGRMTMWDYRHLIAHKAWADFRAESQRNYLGVLWWILDPIINTAIYYLVFGVFFNRGGPDYVEFLVIGIIGWNWFAKGVVTAANSIWQSAATIRQVSLRKMVFPTIQMILSTYCFFFSLIVLIGALLIFGETPRLIWILALIPMVVQFLLIAAMGFTLSAIIPFFPDLSNFLSYFIRFCFYLSAVMYKLESLPERWQQVLWWNPMVHILDAYRAPLMYGVAPGWRSLALLAVLSLVGIGVGLVLIDRFDGAYAKRIVR